MRQVLEPQVPASCHIGAVRDASSGEVTENTGIVRPPFLIVALTNDDAGEGLEQA